MPSRCVSNQELAEDLARDGVETSDEWISTRTGIKQRYLASGDETTAGLGAKAAIQALDRSGLAPEEIDLIIVATTTPDQVFPSTACQIQDELGCRNAGAFDVQAVCSGFAYSMSIADSMIRSGQMKNVLVIGAEILSRILDWKDRTTCVLFGDGAGAVVLQASSEPGILAWEIKADGSRGAGVLSTPGRMENGAIVGMPFIQMNGKAVFVSAIEKMTESGRKMMARAGIDPSEIKLFIPHQANLRIMNQVTQRLAIAPENMMVTVDTHGNTSAASIPLALNKAVTQGRIRRGDLVLVQGVGGGFTWASVLIKY